MLFQNSEKKRYLKFKFVKWLIAKQTFISHKKRKAKGMEMLLLRHVQDLLMMDGGYTHTHTHGGILELICRFLGTACSPSTLHVALLSAYKETFTITTHTHKTIYSLYLIYVLLKHILYLLLLLLLFKIMLDKIFVHISLFIYY